MWIHSLRKDWCQYSTVVYLHANPRAHSPITATQSVDDPLITLLFQLSSTAGAGALHHDHHTINVPSVITPVQSPLISQHISCYCHCCCCNTCVYFLSPVTLSHDKLNHHCFCFCGTCAYPPDHTLSTPFIKRRKDREYVHSRAPTCCSEASTTVWQMSTGLLWRLQCSASSTTPLAVHSKDPTFAPKMKGALLFTPFTAPRKCC